MLEVMLHALDWLEANSSRPDALVLLQPTSPLRSSTDIDGAISIFLTDEASTVVSVVEIPHNFTPTSALLVEDGRIIQPTGRNAPTRRQDKTRLFARNGPAVLVTNPATLRQGLLYGDPTLTYEMPKERSYDIDDPTDLAIVECLLSRLSR
jgi:CMP-N-acetylneuraminic acid synthetase